MKAIILAAGRGSRNNDLTDDLPKCLLKIGNKSLRERQNESLTQAGIHDIYIVGGYKINSLFAYNRPLYRNEKWESTNMVHSLLCAYETLKNFDCIVSYGDIFYSDKIVSLLSKSKEMISVAYDKNWLSLWKKRFENVLDDAESFKKDVMENIIEIGKQANTIDEIEGQYMGLLKFKKEFWVSHKDFLDSIPANSSMTDFLQTLIQRGVGIKGVENIWPWGEADSPEDIEVYESNV